MVHSRLHNNSPVDRLEEQPLAVAHPYSSDALEVDEREDYFLA